MANNATAAALGRHLTTPNGEVLQHWNADSSPILRRHKGNQGWSRAIAQFSTVLAVTAGLVAVNAKSFLLSLSFQSFGFGVRQGLLHSGDPSFILKRQDEWSIHAHTRSFRWYLACNQRHIRPKIGIYPSYFNQWISHEVTVENRVVLKNWALHHSQLSDFEFRPFFLLVSADETQFGKVISDNIFLSTGIQKMALADKEQSA